MENGIKNCGVYEPQSILVTGAAGFIASHVANRLVRKYPHYKIVVLDKLDYCSNLKNLNPSRSSPNFKFVKGDIGSADLVHYLLETERIDTIMHFAAQTHVDNSFGNSFEFTKNNIYGTHVLLEACKVTGSIRRFIHVSTDEVYGETEQDAIEGNHEASQLLPTNPYSATKAGAEMLVMAYGRSYGLPVITTRGNNVYGPNQFPEKLIPKFILLAMNGKPLPIHGDGSNVRSYLYCEDVAEAFEVVLHRGEVGHVYNIGTQKERRVIDVAKDICALFGRDPDTVIKFVENRPFNDQRYYLDDTKLKELGWSERTKWEDGLKKTMDWYLSNPGWWGDVSGALLPHPRMLAMAGVERGAESTDTVKEDSQSAVLSSTPVNGASAAYRFLIYGKDNKLGELLGQICAKQGISVEYGTSRLEDRAQIQAEIENAKPTHVWNAAGISVRSTVDWCESHKVEAIRSNVAAALNLADVCRENGVLLVHFSGEDSHGEANNSSALSSNAKYMVEELLQNFENVCTLRVKVPVASDWDNSSNFITKLVQSGKVANLTTNISVVEELLPSLIKSKR